MTYAFDLDGTVAAAPEQFKAIAKGLRKQGHRVIVVTARPADEASAMCDRLAFPHDELFSVDAKKHGKGKAEVFAAQHVDMAFDNKSSFGHGPMTRVCPLLLMAPGDKGE